MGRHNADNHVAPFEKDELDFILLWVIFIHRYPLEPLALCLILGLLPIDFRFRAQDDEFLVFY